MTQYEQTRASTRAGTSRHEQARASTSKHEQARASTRASTSKHESKHAQVRASTRKHEQHEQARGSTSKHDTSTTRAHGTSTRYQTTTDNDEQRFYKPYQSVQFSQLVVHFKEPAAARGLDFTNPISQFSSVSCSFQGARCSERPGFYKPYQSVSSVSSVSCSFQGPRPLSRTMHARKGAPLLTLPMETCETTHRGPWAKNCNFLVVFFMFSKKMTKTENRLFLKTSVSPRRNTHFDGRPKTTKNMFKKTYVTKRRKTQHYIRILTIPLKTTSRAIGQECQFPNGFLMFSKNAQK